LSRLFQGKFDKFPVSGYTHNNPTRIHKEKEKIVDENINLSEWYNPTEAAKIIGKNSDKVIRPDYVRKLAQYGKIRKIKISDRASLYWKADVDHYRVEERGVRSGKAAKKRAEKRKRKESASEEAA
jgi:hypothetical protein